MRLRGSRNQCRGCDEYFNSNKAFEFHRAGKHGVNRRCLVPDEMTAKGMFRNSQGFWVTEANQRFEESSDERETDEAGDPPVG